MVPRSVVLGLCLAGIANACGGAEPGPIPMIEGVYRGTWSLAVEGDRVSCPASLTISDQTDSAFATLFEVRRRNGQGLGCVDTIQTGSGSVRSNGSVTALAGPVEPVSCTLAEPNRGLSGPIRGDSIDLSGRYTYECPPSYTWTLRFAGSTNGPALPGYADVRGAYTGTWTTRVQSVSVTCPVSLSISQQTRDEFTGAYALEAEGSCLAQEPEALSGTITVDGEVSVTGTPPVPTGCTAEGPFSLTGLASVTALELIGGFLIRCSGVLRPFEVSLVVVR